MPKSKRLHFKDIDALRFFAFIPVFLFSIFFLTRTSNEGIHQELTVLIGFLKINSLDFFFFVSAFLLTSHGLREYKYTNAFSLRGFFIRRFMRLGPVFIIGLSFAFFVHPWILKILKLNSITAPSFFKFLTLSPQYLDSFTKEQFLYLAVLGSIYMFIIFSAIWGIVLKYFKSSLFSVAVLFIVTGIIARIVHHFIEITFEFDLLAYGVAIGLGTLLAKGVREESPLLNKVKTIPKKVILPIYIGGLLVLLLGYIVTSNFILVSVMPIITCLYFSFLIVDQTFGKNQPFKLRDFKVITHLGKISYGMIVYQSILSVLIVIGIDSLDFEINSSTVKVAFAGVGFIFTWIVADLSYNFFEKPLLRLRREFKKS